MKVTLGIKSEMTQVFDEDGTVVPVTVVNVADTKVVGFKTEERDGYKAVVLGIGKKKRPTKPEIGKFKELGYVPQYISEFRIDDVEGLNIGDEIDLSKFELGKGLDITGITKGKGFQGVVRKFGFAGGPKTHGQSDRWRAPGSIGSGTTPGRVYKGKKMPGRMGNERMTVENLKLIEVDTDNHLLLVKGAVPGKRGGFIMIKQK